MQRRHLGSILRISFVSDEMFSVFAGLFAVTSCSVVRGLWQGLGWSQRATAAWKAVSARAIGAKNFTDVSSGPPSSRGLVQRCHSLYINVDAFKKAGVDPNKPPQTLDEIMTAAKKLTIKDANGQVQQYGFGAAIYGWFLEQLIAESNQPYCNLENGRKGLATEVGFGGQTGTRVATWWADMVKQGLATNTGRKTDDAQAAFKSGKVAMNLESTGALKGYLAAAQGKFALATALSRRSTPALRAVRSLAAPAC